MTTVIHVFDVVILLRRDNSDAEVEKLEKIISLVHIASKYVDKYFDICISLNFITNYTDWNGEDAVFFVTNGTRTTTTPPLGHNSNVHVQQQQKDEIVSNLYIKNKTAKFGHYLYALIYGIMAERHNAIIRQTLSWYFMIQLTETAKYVRPKSSSIGLDDRYMCLIDKVYGVIGNDTLKEFALGRIHTNKELPGDIQKHPGK
jgi:hypothetical protein